MEEIQQLWSEHLNARFPEDVVGDEIDGECLVSLDTFTAGCIDTFLSKSGFLDLDQFKCLVRCRDGLNKVIPKLGGEPLKYYSRLNKMSQLTLQIIDSRTNEEE